MKEQMKAVPLKHSIEIKSVSKKWYKRVWILISNPFRYVFTGKIVY